MKKLLTLFAAISMLFVASCGGDAYDDTALRNDLTDLANRVAKLEQLCQQMNTNISSLQTIVNALQQNDFITAVVPVTQGGKVIGYTITFSRSGAITIYHGTDGKNGENGKDGSTPQIGVKKDSDGIYYWTLNGEWLLDANGNKIQAEGKDGADGSNGSNGVDGITPQLKIEEGYWYISYDNGSTWTQLGKAVGEDGADGSDWNNFFLDVQQDDEFVYFYLADGTMITLPKHDKENIQFEDLLVKSICCRKWDTNGDGELSYAEAAAVTDIGTTFYQKDIIAFTELKYFTGLTAISSAFTSCSKLWKIEIPYGVAKIDGAFNGCSSLSKISLPQSLQEISGFQGCTNLKEITIPDGVTIIGFQAFYECSMLETVNLPKTLKKINYGAFYSCNQLTHITIPDAVTEIEMLAFKGCSKLRSVVVSKNLVSIGASAFASCYSLISVDLPATLSYIGSGAFRECYAMETLYCRAITPPRLEYKDTFHTPTIYVPYESLSAYELDPYWGIKVIYGYDFEEDPHHINQK